MHTIRINGQSRPLGGNFESWVAHQFRIARERGQTIVFRVDLGGDLNLGYQCPPPATGGGGTPVHEPSRLRVLDFFQHESLCGRDLTPGGVIAFLKKLLRFL